MFIAVEAKPAQQDRFGSIHAEITDFQIFDTAQAALNFVQMAIEMMPDYHALEIWHVTRLGSQRVWNYTFNKAHVDRLTELAQNEATN